MSRECYNNCPKIASMYTAAEYATECASPIQEETIWKALNRATGNLANDCEGPAVVDTKIVEIKLSFYQLKRLLGKKATESVIVPIYGCSKEK